MNPISGSAAAPAVNKNSTPEGGGFQATLNQSLKAEVAAHKEAGASSTPKAQANSSTASNGNGKSGKDKERELTATGLAPVAPDPLAALPVVQTPQQILLAQGASDEGDTAVPSAEASKLAQAQGLAFTPLQARSPQGNTASAQNGIADQDVRAATLPPDAASSSKQEILAAASSSPASVFPPATSNAPTSSAASSAQPGIAREGSKQEPATDAASIPIPTIPPAATVNAVPGFGLPNLSASRITTIPSSTLTGTTLNSGHFSQPGDGKPKQLGSALDTSSSTSGENRNTALHTFGTTLVVEPSAAVVAGANGANTTFVPTGEAVLTAASSSANGHAAADVSGSETSAGLPAASAADIAPQTAAAAEPAINTARVLETLHGTELRLGLHSTEFGSISIATSVSSEGIAAQIALDHSTLGKALATHLTSMEEKLGSSFGLPAKVELRDGTASGLQGNGAGTANANENSRGNTRQQWTGREAEQSARARGGLSGSIAATESRAGTDSGMRLSVQA